MKKSLAIVDPKIAREAVRKHLARLQGSNNAVQFQAQRYETEMVDLLAQFARDPDLPPALRRQTAIDVLTYARGAVKPWLHDAETIDPTAQGAAGLGATIGQELEAARQTAGLHEQLARLTAANVHPRDWPAEVRSVAAGLVAFYDAEDGTIDGKVA